LSFSESKIGSALAKLGEIESALVILRSGVDRQESLVAKDPHHILLYNHLANSYTRIANCLLDNRDTKAAVEYFRKAVGARLAFSEKSPNSSTNRRALAECYINLGKALFATNREDALKQYTNAIEMLEHLTATDRTNARYRIALADALSSTAGVYVRAATQDGESEMRLYDWTEARSFYQRSQELWLELSRTSKIPAARVGETQKVSTELARCDQSLAKLHSIK